jgi:hypothetical protein
MRAVHRSVLVAGVLALLAAQSAAGSILFSNLFEPGDQYGPDGIGIGHTPTFTDQPSDYLEYAVHFRPNATALLTSFELPVLVLSG